jgi:hypothetical protein
MYFCSFLGKPCILSKNVSFTITLLILVMIFNKDKKKRINLKAFQEAKNLPCPKKLRAGTMHLLSYLAQK